jgi:hypothetical protein
MLIQIAATKKLVELADFLAHELIADGRAKKAMIRVLRRDPWAAGEEMDPNAVVIEVPGDDLTRVVALTPTEQEPSG